jgi:hypothetical protein
MGRRTGSTQPCRDAAMWAVATGAYVSLRNIIGLVLEGYDLQKGLVGEENISRPSSATTGWANLRSAQPSERKNRRPRCSCALSLFFKIYIFRDENRIAKFGDGRLTLIVALSSTAGLRSTCWPLVKPRKTSGTKQGPI